MTIAEPHAQTATVLLVGPIEFSHGVLLDILKVHHWHYWEAGGLDKAVEILNNNPVSVAICEAEIEDGNWQLLLADLQSREHPPNLIVCSRLADERLWAEVLNLGGYDVLEQPFDASEVLRVTQMAWSEWHYRKRLPQSFRQDLWPAIQSQLPSPTITRVSDSTRG